MRGGACLRAVVACMAFEERVSVCACVCMCPWRAPCAVCARACVRFNVFSPPVKVCNLPAPLDCAVHMRASSDGWDWGDPTDLGTLVADATTGSFFAHTPVLASWAAASSVLVTAQVGVW